MSRRTTLVALLVLAGSAPAAQLTAQDRSIPFTVEYIEAHLLAEPLQVLDMAQARPAITGDRSARVTIAGSDEANPIIAKWKPVGRNGEGFNNEPRYELAAYRLQKLFLDEPEYVVPPTVLRAKDLADYQALRPASRPTFGNTSSVLFLLAYWTQAVTNKDPWDAERFQRDTLYARYWGNVNILTHLIEHKDYNLGNLLISTDPQKPRVFSVDNDVAFRSRSSDMGDGWRHLLVDRLPAHAVERLRTITREDLDATLGVVAEFEVADGRLVRTEPGPNLNARRGVRRTADRIQFGLTEREIMDIEERIAALLRQVERGRITTF